MDKIDITNEIWDLAIEYCKEYFPVEKVANHPTHRFWVEGSNPNFQGILGELAFVKWLGKPSYKEYLNSKPTFRRDKGKDIVLGNLKIDVKTPALRITPQVYHKFLIEDVLIDRAVADIYVCQFIIKPEMKEVYLMGYSTPKDIKAFGEYKTKGETIYGRVNAGYNGYLVSANGLDSPDELREKLKDLQVQDALLSQ